MGITKEQYEIVVVYILLQQNDYRIQEMTGVPVYYIRKIRKKEPVPIIGLSTVPKDTRKRKNKYIFI